MITFVGHLFNPGRRKPLHKLSRMGAMKIPGKISENQRDVLVAEICRTDRFNHQVWFSARGGFL
jgi:hypothetical protein